MWRFIYWFLDWMKKTTINPKNHGNRCAQFVAIIALNSDEIKRDSQRVSSIKLIIINNYNWERKNYPSKIEDWKQFEKNNLAVALNVLYIREKVIRAA